MLSGKDKTFLKKILDTLMSDGSDMGDSCYRVNRRIITEMLGLDYSNETLLKEGEAKPIYYPENYQQKDYKSERTYTIGRYVSEMCIPSRHECVEKIDAHSREEALEKYKQMYDCSYYPASVIAVEDNSSW